MVSPRTRNEPRKKSPPVRLYCSATRSAISWRCVDAPPCFEREGHRRIGLDRADAVDAGHRGDDDHVVALEQRARRRMAHAVDLLVDRGFLLDIGVGARHVGFRLVVVVIGDEILDRVVGEERLELAVELRRQRLVGREDERRALRRLDHLGHGEGLARAGDAEQHLRAVVALHALDQVLDRLRLVAFRLELGVDRRGAGRLRISPAAAGGAASRLCRSSPRCGIRRGPRAAAGRATARWRRRPSRRARCRAWADRRAAGGIWKLPSHLPRRAPLLPLQGEGRRAGVSSCVVPCGLPPSRPPSAGDLPSGGR